MTFDYAASAELFISKKGGRGARQPLSYRRFPTAAEAIRFVVEDFPAIRTLGAWMRVGDDHFNGDDIRRLYESNGYPRRRRMRKSVEICTDIGLSLVYVAMSATTISPLRLCSRLVGLSGSAQAQPGE